MSDNLLSGKPGLGSRAHFGLQSVDKLTWAFLKSDQWTYCDQRRLNSIDSLVSRSLEYHNLNHSFRTIDRRLEQRLGPVAADALEFVYLGEDAPAGAPYSCQVSISQMRTFLDGLGRYGRSRGVCWLHVRDLRALGPLARHFKMDYICQAGFHDLRSHSNVHCTHDAMFMTLCTVAMLEDFHFYKSYVYASKGVCITFERELLADLSSGKEPIGDLMWEGLSRRIVGLVRRCGQMGSMHFIYEMAKEMMDLSDGVLEFVSRATSYITVTMNKDVSFQQLLSIYRKIHILRSSLQVLDRQIAESHRFFAQMMDTWSSTHQRAIQSVLQPVNLPYLSDVTDSYRYRSETLKYMNSEQLSEILDTLTALRNIRTIKTNIDLTLIATVFLPLTFIASVFGMVS